MRLKQEVTALIKENAELKKLAAKNGPGRGGSTRVARAPLSPANGAKCETPPANDEERWAQLPPADSLPPSVAADVFVDMVNSSPRHSALAKLYSSQTDCKENSVSCGR